jgi:hypothetical protein
MKRLAEELADLANQVNEEGMHKDASKLFLMAVRVAHDDHILKPVLDEMGFEETDLDEKPSKTKTDIYIEISPDGYSEYKVSKSGNADMESFETFEELMSFLADEDCGCDDHKTASSKNKGKTLNKPFRTPGGPKKFSVYVKNDKGNVVKVNFGDPNMRIKKSNPKRRKSFRARHNCDNPGPKWKARYWSCRNW